MIAIIDYGMGNLRSVQKGFEKIGASSFVTSDAAALDAAEKIVLPGVGAIADAMAALHAHRLIEPIRRAVESDKPFLGICLGFQLLFNSSEENGHCEALGLIAGEVVRFERREGFPVPHIGWNTLRFGSRRAPIFSGLNDGTHVYFVHSYYACCAEAEAVASTTDYGVDFCSSIARGHLFGTQFHPEKSQANGLRILKNFADL